MIPLRLEIVSIVDRGEDLEGRGLGWRRLDICFAATRGYAIEELDVQQWIGRETETGAWVIGRA